MRYSLDVRKETKTKKKENTKKYLLYMPLRLTLQEKNWGFYVPDQRTASGTPQRKTEDFLQPPGDNLNRNLSIRNAGTSTGIQNPPSGRPSPVSGNRYVILPHFNALVIGRQKQKRRISMLNNTKLDVHYFVLRSKG